MLMAACVLTHAAIALPDDGEVASPIGRAMGFRPPRRAASIPNPDAATGKKVRSLLKTSPLPAAWNSCDQGWISPIRNQGNVGACWTFATCATIEAQLRKNGQGDYDLSEKNMVNLNGWRFEPNDGGNYDMAAAYLLRWGGAVAETNDVYVGTLYNWTPSPELSPIIHIQQVVWVPPLDGTSARIDELKRAIKEYGAVAVSTYWSTTDKQESVYRNVEYGHTHAVTLVGWDDNYPTNKFNPQPSGKGAWIMRNSWGAGVGSNGYHYVSYYDRNIARNYDGAVFIPASADEDYDVVRGYDPLGPVYDVSIPRYDYTPPQIDLQAASFTAGHGERLEAVGVWTSVYPNDFEISIYTNVTRYGTSPITNGVLAVTREGPFAHAGFTTVHLDSPIDLVDGDGFAVVYRPRYRTTMVNCALGDWCEPTHNYGESYFGRTNGMGVVTWQDGTEAYKEVDETDISWGACIKAYTRLTGKVREGDKPAETDVGDKYLADLAATNSVLYAETGRTFGASAGVLGANGRTLWASWLTGLDPDDPDATDLKLSIAVTNSVPYLSWTPKLDARHYTVYGTTALGPNGVWEAVGDLATTTNRFFKVAVGQAASQE